MKSKFSIQKVMQLKVENPTDGKNVHTENIFIREQRKEWNSRKSKIVQRYSSPLPRESCKPGMFQAKIQNIRSTEQPKHWNV